MTKKADFSGWATKYGVLCTDGKTIRPGAFAHQDKREVPLVWHHKTQDIDAIIGHAVLENRPDGVYTHAYFNENPKAKLAKELVRHGDIKMMSIWANRLTSMGNDVLRGDIKDVSLVPAGANSEAVIDNIYIEHGDSFQELEGEAIIYSGLEIEHSDSDQGDNMTDELNHEDEKAQLDDPTIQQTFDSLTDQQKELFDYFVTQAIEETKKELAIQHGENIDEEAFLAHVDSKIQEGFTTMANVFEQANKGNSNEEIRHSLTSDQFQTIMADAKKNGSLKEAVLSHADEYGITDINFLFPDAKNIQAQPDFIKRRTEWVSSVLGGARSTPISRIRTIHADITADEARAKGYATGALKKDEVIRLLRRVTTPTTIYKKQKLDRDDILDITSFDVVAFLKGEMRLMLEEELARQILFGDGREADDPDRIDPERIRPIAWDDDMYTTRVNIGSGLTPNSLAETIIRSRRHYKGTGNPTMYTTEDVLIDLLLAKDKMGRELYSDVDNLAKKLRVKEIVAVEAMESQPSLLAILVNMDDYSVGADAGGQISMFDDFDIDYNQQKYLLETRVSGALTKPKSAVAITRTVGTVVTPTAPAFDDATNTLTIPTVPGVEYLIEDVVVTGEVPVTDFADVVARPAAGYSFPNGVTTTWTYAAA